MPSKAYKIKGSENGGGLTRTRAVDSAADSLSASSL
jgi:hypothetical protein